MIVRTEKRKYVKELSKITANGRDKTSDDNLNKYLAVVQSVNIFEHSVHLC